MITWEDFFYFDDLVRTSNAKYLKFPNITSPDASLSQHQQKLQAKLAFPSWKHSELGWIQKMLRLQTYIEFIEGV